MAASRNIIAAWLALVLPCVAQFTDTFYPPTNAPPRTYDGTNYVFAKDVWWEELGGATLERMAVLGLYDSQLAEPPIRDPLWDNQVCAAVKSNLLAISTEYLDLRYTNSAGVFTNFYDTSGASYSNRYWTKSNLLAFCSLPTNFFEWTPARYLGPNGITNGNTNLVSGYSTVHYGWEGVYRVVLALNYYHPRPAWIEEKLDDTVTATDYDTATNTNICDFETYSITAPYTTWTPTNQTTNVVIGSAGLPTPSSGGLVELIQFANIGTVEEITFANPLRAWAVYYNFDVPNTLKPGAKVINYPSTHHPTNALDAQAFNRANGAYYNGTNHFAAIHYKNSNAVYSAQVPTPTNTYTLYSRWAGNITQIGTNYVIASTSIISAVTGSVNVAAMTLNPTNSCGAEYGYSTYNTIDGPTCGHSYGASPFYSSPVSLLDIPYTQETDPCSPTDEQWSTWYSRYEQAAIQNNVAVRPGWKYRADD